MASSPIKIQSGLSQSDKLLPWLALSVGLLLTWTVYSWLNEAKINLIRNVVAQQSITIQKSINEEVLGAVDTLTGLKGLFEASTFVSSREFAQYSNSFLTIHPYIHSLEWIAIVPHRNRTELERLLTDSSSSPFVIFEDGPENKLVSASDRDNYFPVIYAASSNRAEDLRGYDLGSNPLTRQTIEAALKSASVRTTPTIRLPDSHRGEQGILMFMPISPSPTVLLPSENRLDSYSGLVAGVFSIAQLLDPVIENNPELFRDLNITLFETGQADRKLLFQRRSGSDNGIDTEAVLVDVFLPGQHWQLSVEPTQAYFDKQYGSEAMTVLLMGVLLSGLFGIWIRTLIRREKQVAKLVEERTSRLELSEEKNKAIIDSAIDAIITIDGKGTVSLFNPAAEAMFGYNASEVVGNNVNMLMPEPHHSNHDHYLSNYLKTGDAKVIGIGREVEGRHKSGELFPMHLSVGQVGHGESRQFVGVIKNMSAEMEIRDQLIRAKETAEITSKQQAAFINTTSHELRTPLTVILGYLPLLKNAENTLSSEMVATIANEMDESGQHLLSLINDILDYSKLGSGKLKLSFTDENLYELLQRGASSFRWAANQKGLRLEINADEALIRVDRRRVLQILNNLIGNSMKFTREGFIQVTGTLKQGGVLISVEDSGIGIPEDEVERVIEAFHQVDSSSTRQVGGTGLGLAITRELVALHHGEIRVTSQVGKGTRISLSLNGSLGDEDGKDLIGGR